MKKISKIVTAIVLGAMMTSPFITSSTLAVATKSTKPLNIQIDGKGLKIALYSIIEKGRNLVPVKVFYQMGAEAKLDKENNCVWIYKGKMSIELPFGKETMLIHRQDDFTGIPEKVKLDVAARLVNGEAYVPLRAVAEALGAKVSIDKTAIIIKTIPAGNPVKQGKKPAQAVEKNISLGDVSGIEVVNLDGIKVKDLTKDEIQKIIEHYNDAPMSDAPYVMMITGNQLVIDLVRGDKVTFTSYGSKTNFVAAGMIGGKSFSYHVIDEYIANMLLGQ